MYWTHITNEVSDIIRIGGSRFVYRCWHKHWGHVIPEHLGAVVQTTMEDTKIKVLMKR